MLFESLEQFATAIKKLIFDLSVHGYSDEADRINRLVFEDSRSGTPEYLPELAALLRDVRSELPHRLRDQLAQFESFARNHKRVGGGAPMKNPPKVRSAA